jgi:hypothetical protein
MAVCCQNLPLGVVSSRSAPSVLVGEIFKKFGLFFEHRYIYIYVYLTWSQNLRGCSFEPGIVRVYLVLSICKSSIQNAKPPPFGRLHEGNVGADVGWAFAAAYSTHCAASLFHTSLRHRPQPSDLFPSPMSIACVTACKTRHTFCT